MLYWEKCDSFGNWESYLLLLSVFTVYTIYGCPLRVIKMGYRLYYCSQPIVNGWCGSLPSHVNWCTGVSRTETQVSCRQLDWNLYFFANPFPEFISWELNVNLSRIASISNKSQKSFSIRWDEFMYSWKKPQKAYLRHFFVSTSLNHLNWSVGSQSKIKLLLLWCWFHLMDIPGSGRLTTWMHLWNRAVNGCMPVAVT